MTESVDKTMGLAYLAGQKVLYVVITLLFFLLLNWFVKVFFVKTEAHADTEDSRKALKLVSTIVRTAVFVIGGLTALSMAGVDISAALTGLGLTGFALGYALKDAISNVLSGILVMVYRPFETGDEIEISGCKGKIVQVNLRYTVIDDGDNQYLVPNSMCFSNWVKKTKPKEGVKKDVNAVDDNSDLPY